MTRRIARATARCIAGLLVAAGILLVAVPASASDRAVQEQSKQPVELGLLDLVERLWDAVVQPIGIAFKISNPEGAPDGRATSSGEGGELVEPLNGHTVDPDG